MAHRLCKLAKRFTYVRIKFYDDIGVVFMRAYNKVLSALAVFISISLTAEAASRSDVVTLDNVSAFTEDCVNVFMRNSTVNY
jgi:allantoicase